MKYISSRPKKHVCQNRHAKNRARQRYGINVGDSMLNRMVNIIQCGDAEVVEKQSNRVSVFLVIYQEETYRVVYDSKTKTIATFLPKDGVFR